MKFAFAINCLMLSIILLSCNEKSNEIEKENKKVVDTTQVNYQPYQETQKDDSVQYKLSIEKIDQLTYNLVFELKLFGESWIVSPLAFEYPYGPLRIDLDVKNHLTEIDSLIEEPKSKKFYDESYEGSYALIKEKVKLTQKLKITDRSDFKVHGLIFFVLEPICTPYEMTFILTHQKGELTLGEVNFNDILNRALPDGN